MAGEKLNVAVAGLGRMGMSRPSFHRGVALIATSVKKQALLCAQLGRLQHGLTTTESHRLETRQTLCDLDTKGRPHRRQLAGAS